MNLVIPAPSCPNVHVCDPDTKSLFPVHRIYCVGRNYVEHAIEMGHTGREPPFFFMKPADAVLAVDAGQVGKMHYPSQTENLHHEVELVVAIGKAGRDIAVGDALDHVWGYAVGLDMTRRDLQEDMKKQGRPWCIGKGFDESAPIGAITPKDRWALEPSRTIELMVNGTTRQTSTLGKLIWSVPEIIAQLSSAWSLAPGDLIFTGTPQGVSAVSVGDVLSARIAGLETLDVQLVSLNEG